MKHDNGLREFPNICRLFPLPGVVLFPHAVLPLHIFEPRYRQMTEDALAGDKLVTIVQLKPGADADALAPELEEVGCLGRILSHERLPDGRFNFLLLGLKRVRLVRELPSSRLYRTAQTELIEDEDRYGPNEPRRGELIRLFRTIAERHESLGDDFDTLLQSGISLGALTDIMAHALGLPADMKQSYLNDACVERRVESLVELLGQLANQMPVLTHSVGSFPPEFSLN